MTILHYIPAMNITKGSAPHYVNALVRSTARVASSYVIEEKDLGKSLLEFIHHAYKKLKEHRPDIVHVHASWNLRAAIFAELARRLGLFVVVSPHGGVVHEVLGQRFWKEKLPRILAYQFRMIRKSRLVVTVSEKEHEKLKRLGWKNRMILVPDPTLSSISDDELSSQIMAAYRKVIDTHYLERITENEIDFTIRCVKEALQRDGHFLTPGDPYELPEGLSFRRIYIFAHDNDVTPLLFEGAKRLGIPMPTHLNVAELPRFKEKAKRQSGREKSFSKFCNILKSEIPSAETEKLFSEKLFTPQGEISLFAFANVYSAMRFNDYDEEQFMSRMKDARLDGYTSRLMGLFEEIFGLEEGFMPIAPR